MKLKINEISQVIVGYTFRGAITQNTNGNAYVLQAKNVKQNQNIRSTEELVKVLFPTFRSLAFIKSNDVLLLSRGSGAGTFRACVFKSDANNVIASSSVHIIRVKSPFILPEYLALYLNSKEGQQSIDQIATGTHFQIVSRALLDELFIPIPSMKQQQLLIDLYTNIKSQEELTARKQEIYDNLMNATIKQFLSV